MIEKQGVGLNATALHDELLAAMPEGSRHDSDICPFCVDHATADQTRASVPSGDKPSGASEDNNPTVKGGIAPTMTELATETLSRETHDALLAKGIKDATSVTEAALDRKTTEAAELTTKVASLTTDNATLTTDNARLNKELDTAQVSLKGATDEVAALKADNAAKDEASRKAEVASKRSEQVRNLKLFPDEYISEKASKWAEATDDDWAERIEEWQKAKPVATGDGKTETASAMTGTTEALTTESIDTAGKKIPARRSVLGLS